MWILFIIVVFAILWAIFAYNSLISRKNRVDEAWSDIEVQLKRRYDLIPNIVETVKGYAGHEKTVLENVVKARAAAMGATSEKDRLQAENALSGTLKSLFALAENYPQLRANENFLQLQRELVDTEDKIQAARRFYNSNVRDYNISLESFPTNLIAGWFRFTRRELFDIDEKGAGGQPVKVQF